MELSSVSRRVVTRRAMSTICSIVQVGPGGVMPRCSSRSWLTATTLV
jgi:hypothetical protein